MSRRHRQVHGGFAAPTLSSAIRESHGTEERRQKGICLKPTSLTNFEIGASSRVGGGRVDISVGINVNKPAVKENHGMGHYDFSKPSFPTAAREVRITPGGNSLRSVSDGSHNGQSGRRQDQSYNEKHTGGFHQNPRSRPLSDNISLRNAGTRTHVDRSPIIPATGNKPFWTERCDSRTVPSRSTSSYNEHYGKANEEKHNLWSWEVSEGSQMPSNKDKKHSSGHGTSFDSHDAQRMYQQQLFNMYAENGASRDSSLDTSESKKGSTPNSRISPDNESVDVAGKLTHITDSVDTCAVMNKTSYESVETLLEKTFGDQPHESLQLKEKETENNKLEEKCLSKENTPETNGKRTPGSVQMNTEKKREPVGKEDGTGAIPKQKQTNIKPRGGDQDDSPYRKYDHRQREWRRDEDIAKQSLNLKFYKNELSSKPWGNKIEEMLTWKGDYRKLESNHSYIQWLFPTQDYSMINSYAQPIQFHEAEEIRESPQLRLRFLSAYVMMLDFYGMALKSEYTGQVERSKNWKDRFRHLNRSSHNFYRITRILIALGVFGFEHFQEPWLLFLMKERFEYKTLPDIPFGVLHHWIGSVNNEDARTRVMIEFTELSDGADGRDRPRSAWNQHRSSARASKGGAGLDSHDNEKMQQLNISKQDGGGSAVGDLIDVGGAAASQDSINDVTLQMPDMQESEGRDDSLRQSLVQRQTDTRNGETRDRPVQALQSQRNTQVEGEGRELDKKMRDSQRNQQIPDENERRKADSFRNSMASSCRSDHGGRYDQRQRDDDDGIANQNLKFYKNEIESKPAVQGLSCRIEDILKWKGDHKIIENCALCLTWLFPTAEGSRINAEAQPLQYHEAKIIRETPELQYRFLRAYEMMLEYYGMELTSVETGEVCRARNYIERFQHINRASTHTHRMITRILTALGTFGFEQFQVQWLEFIIFEVKERKTLSGIDGFVLTHWIDALNREEDRTRIAIKLTEYTDS